MGNEILLKDVQIDELSLETEELAYALSRLSAEKQVNFIKLLDEDNANWDFTVKCFRYFKNVIEENLDEVLEDNLISETELTIPPKL